MRPQVRLPTDLAARAEAVAATGRDGLTNRTDVVNECLRRYLPVLEVAIRESMSHQGSAEA